MPFFRFECFEMDYGRCRECIVALSRRRALLRVLLLGPYLADGLRAVDLSRNACAISKRVCAPSAERCITRDFADA